MQISLQQFEAAINYWRSQQPATGEEKTLCREAALLAKPYALMIYQHRATLDSSALNAETLAALQTGLQAD
jgi:hypothetical protein